MLLNGRTNGVIAQNVEMADTRATRRRGLLGRDGLDASAALVLLPSFAIHTAFMRFPIDALFVDRDGVVVRRVERLEPWRIAVAWRAHAVVELAAGALAHADVRVGDRLSLVADGRSAGL
jgi:uncharacterized protein